MTNIGVIILDILNDNFLCASNQIAIAIFFNFLSMNFLKEKGKQNCFQQTHKEETCFLHVDKAKQV